MAEELQVLASRKTGEALQAHGGGMQEGGVQCLRSVMYDVAHLAATLGSGSDGHLRGRFMSISNALNAAIGRQQSSHGDQYDDAGKIVKSDPLNGYDV